MTLQILAGASPIRHWDSRPGASHSCHSSRTAAECATYSETTSLVRGLQASLATPPQMWLAQGSHSRFVELHIQRYPPRCIQAGLPEAPACSSHPLGALPLQLCHWHGAESGTARPGFDHYDHHCAEQKCNYSTLSIHQYHIGINGLAYTGDGSPLVASTCTSCNSHVVF